MKIHDILTEAQRFDFDKHRDTILRFVQNTLAGKPNNRQFNPFYELIVGGGQVGAANKLGIDPKMAATWKQYFQSKPFLGGAGEPWSQVNIGDQYAKATGDDRTLNFYVTVSKDKDNIMKFFRNYHSLASYLQPISQQNQTPIKFKTHSILDSFIGHNDSFKVYYYDPKLRNQIVAAVKKWLSDSGVSTAARSHEHGVDVKSNGGSFGQLLSNHVYDEFTKLIKTNGAKVTPEQYFDWLKKNLPVLIAQVKPKEQMTESWSKGYKKSIDCSNPKGFGMRASEFITETPLDPSTSSKILAMATRQKYQLLGQGADATVFGSSTHRPKTVVKITSGELYTSAKKASIGFDHFYEFCQQHPDSPYLPKFEERGFFEVNREKIPWVRMERLNEHPQDLHIYAAVDTLIEESFKNEFADWKLVKSLHPKLTLQQLGMLKKFYSMLSELTDYFWKKRSKLKWDLGKRNIMYRSNVPVITDPFMAKEREEYEESWSKSYKKSIDCSNPKGFSQRAHCAGRKARRAGKKTKSGSVSEEGELLWSSMNEARANSVEDYKPTDQQLDDLKSKYLPNWEMSDHKMLQARYIAKDHRRAEKFIRFINQVSERMDHFAKVTQDVSEVTVETTTFDVKGLTILDFQLASAIDKYAERNQIEQARSGGNFEMYENFADGEKPGRKGLAKRSGVDCKQSVSKLRSVAKNSTGEKQRIAHWCANMKSGKKK